MRICLADFDPQKVHSPLGDSLERLLVVTRVDHPDVAQPYGRCGHQASGVVVLVCPIDGHIVREDVPDVDETIAKLRLCCDCNRRELA